MNATSENPLYFRLIIPVCLALALFSLTFGPFNENHGRNGTQSYTYDSAGRLTQVVYGDGHVLTYTYDANGNILSVDVSRTDEIFFDGFEALTFLNPFRWGLHQ